MGESLVFSFISFSQAKHGKALPEISDIGFSFICEETLFREISISAVRGGKV